MQTELMALAVEVASVTASGKQIKKPIQIPRPKHVKRRSRGQTADGAQPDPYKQGVAVLAATRHRRAVTAR